MQSATPISFRARAAGSQRSHPLPASSKKSRQHSAKPKLRWPHLHRAARPKARALRPRNLHHKSMNRPLYRSAQQPKTWPPRSAAKNSSARSTSPKQQKTPSASTRCGAPSKTALLRASCKRPKTC